MAGPDLTRAVLPSPLGDIVVIADAAGVLHGLDFAGDDGRLDRLAARYWPGARVRDGAAPDAVARALEAYFEGDVRALDALPVAQAGTDFQRRTWAALRTMKTKKVAIKASMLKITARRVMIPAFIPYAIGESERPKQAAQPKTSGWARSIRTTLARRCLTGS